MGLLEASLAGKVAVVLGGAYGVGHAVTLALAQAGVDIATCDNDDEAAAATQKEVEALGRTIFSMHADVTVAAELDRFYDEVEARFDRVDIVVNLAGGVMRRPLMETTREQNAYEIRLNYGYVIDSVRRAVPLIRKKGQGGSVISFTTIEAHRGAATFAVYAGAKAAIENFSRTMAVELGSEQIRFNTIAPDTTPARASYDSIDPKDQERMAKISQAAVDKGFKMYIPLKRHPSREDLGNAVLFLASDLSRSITGITLHVDSGTRAAAGFLDWPFGDGFLPIPYAGTLEQLFPAEK